MIINHVPANAPSHMRQKYWAGIGGRTSIADGYLPRANGGPIFEVGWVGR